MLIDELLVLVVEIGVCMDKVLNDISAAEIVGVFTFAHTNK